jgi:hypothetical protein
VDASHNVSFGSKRNAAQRFGSEVPTGDLGLRTRNNASPYLFLVSSARCSSAHRPHHIFDGDRPSLLELQRSFYCLALRVPTLQPQSHDVIAAGLEFDCCARLDSRPLGSGRIFMTLSSIVIS